MLKVLYKCDECGAEAQARKRDIIPIGASPYEEPLGWVGMMYDRAKPTGDPLHTGHDHFETVQVMVCARWACVVSALRKNPAMDEAGLPGGPAGLAPSEPTEGPTEVPQWMRQLELPGD